MTTSTAAGLRFDDVAVGDEITPVSIPVTYKRICMNAASTWDWFPGHHDPEYARSQGQRTIYLSTLFLHGSSTAASVTGPVRTRCCAAARSR